MMDERALISGLGRALLPALPGWVVGVALQLQQPSLYATGIYVTVTTLAIAGCALAATKKIANRWSTGALTALLAGLLLALGWGSTGWRAAAILEDRLHPALQGQDIEVTGVVASLPQRNEAGIRFRLLVESATLQGKAVALPERIAVTWYGGVVALGHEPAALQRQPAAVWAGERWRMVVRLKVPHGNANPHGFDYELHLWEQGVGATGYVRAGPKDPPPQRLHMSFRAPISWARQHVRDRIERAVPKPSQAGLIAALAVGDQAAIDRADWDVFRATGVAHLVSISGLHITMFAWIAGWCTGRLWRRFAWLCARWPAQSAAWWGGLLLACGYAVFAGWGVPAQRTCTMLLVVIALRQLGLRWPWPFVWLSAAVAVLVIDPWALWQAGFWLSFVAVGVLFALDVHASKAPQVPAPDHRWQTALQRSGFSVLSAAASMARTQGWITLALAPWALLLFGQVSVAGLLANLLAIPWVTLVLTPLALMGVLLPPLWSLAALAADVFMQSLQWLAGFPWAVIALPQAPGWLSLAAIAGTLFLVFPWNGVLRLLGLPLVLPLLLWRVPTPAAGEFELLAADVGQGNAVLVRTAKHALLFDAGPRYSAESDAGHRVIVPLLQAKAVALNALVLSHRDSDHVGGAASVLRMQPSAAVWSSLEAGHPLHALASGKRCEQGQTWEWDGVRFEFLHPQPKDYAQLGLRPNALSCVLRIGNGRQTALLTGDIEASQEARLVQSGQALRADVLLVPHHGSQTSSSAAFLDAVRPHLAIVQSGYRNRFGHPATSVVDRYVQRGTRMVDSPRCGAVTWVSTQPTEVICQREAALRYWHHQLP